MVDDVVDVVMIDEVSSVDREVFAWLLLASSAAAMALEAGAL